MNTVGDNSVQNIADDEGMSQPVAASDEATAAASKTLAGRCAWIISDGVRGHLTITEGVAEALGLAVEVKTVAPRWPWRYLAPWGPPDPRDLAALLREPWPDVVFGAGRLTVPVVRALKRAGQGRIFTVQFQAPQTGTNCAHLIWAPAHDGLEGPNVISTLTPPHRFTPARLAALRATVPPEIASLPSPRVALFIGGPGGGYDYSPEAIASFAARLRAIAPFAGSFLITPSRRTPPALASAVEEATAATPRILWDGAGENPYPQFLAHADAFIVSADSVNMTGEACATGRPVYVLTPAGGRAKFHRYHAALEAYGATRPLPDHPAAFETWEYDPLQAAAAIAQEIECRLDKSL
ncbi:MAG: mitochondrial fission ELM1 family protein [Alphaproteobacteria bacterium]